MADYTWFAKILVDADFEPRTYSGRGMYGKQCLGITLEQFTSPVKAVAQILSTMSQETNAGQFTSDVGDFTDILFEAREDSMGLGTILYFPRIKWDDSYEDPDSEEEDGEDDDVCEACGHGIEEDPAGSVGVWVHCGTHGHDKDADHVARPEIPG